MCIQASFAMRRIAQSSFLFLWCSVTTACLGQQRGIAKVVPIWRSSRHEQFCKQQTYAVFVGIDKFDDPSIVPLKYASSDARAIRDCFVNDLGYLPPRNARLLTTGEEGSDRPTRTNILVAIKKAATRAGTDGCVIVQVSTHGLEGYLLAEDSNRVTLKDTAIPLSTIREWLSSARCPRRLLIIDACRDLFSRGEKSLGHSTMSMDFADAFGSSKGFVVLMSCTQGQVSYEMDEHKHGAFTHFLLQGLRGGAPHDENGFITAMNIGPWLSREVTAWSREEKPTEQTPRITLGDATSDIPLALSYSVYSKLVSEGPQLIEARLARVESGLKFALDRGKALEAQMEDMTADEKELAQAELKIWNERIELLKQQFEAVKNNDRAAARKLDSELMNLWLDWELVNGMRLDLRFFQYCVMLAEKEGDEELLKAAKEYYAICEEYSAKQEVCKALEKKWRNRRTALELKVAPYRIKAAAERAEGP